MRTQQQNNDYAKRIESISDKFLGYLSATLPQRCGQYNDVIRSTVLDLLDFNKPKVMVYGIYNSGKSTIINALMKSEIAEVADRPMTNQIAEYDHGDYILIDSPGIDAPIEHERITEAHLDKCHIILFVISTKGGFESIENYKKMYNLIKRNIPFVIVLNDRGYEININWSQEEKERHKAEHEQELRDIQYKVIENLMKISGDKNIADRYEVVVLNARKALLGALQGKIKLYENSNIVFLEHRVTQIIQDSKALNILYQPIRNLYECFDEVEKEISREMDSTSSVDFSIKIDVLRKKQENLRDRMHGIIRQIIDSRVNEVALSYVEQNAEVAEGIEAEIFRSVEDRYLTEVHDLLSYIARNFKDLDALDFRSILSNESNLVFSGTNIDYSSRNMEKPQLSDEQYVEKKEFWGFLKSRERREIESLKNRAAFNNEKEQILLSEKIRIRQQAIQNASHDMSILRGLIIEAMDDEIGSRFNAIAEMVSDAICDNEQLRDDCRRRLNELYNIRQELRSFENSLS